MSLILRTDVTSVKIHNFYIFAGIGSSLNIFDKKSSRLLQRLLCLNGQKIYGIVPSENGHKILVFGGKQFTVVSCTLAEDNIVYSRLFVPVVCNDWLHSGVWTHEDDIALLTAHNVVQIWNTTKQTLIGQHCSKDNSILYSGLLVPLSDGLLVLAGTVFSQVIVHGYSGEPLHRLVGHNGVIFSISCDIKTARIVTTSDDRSVRIWEPSHTSPHSPNTLLYWQSINIVCKHELYGHCARVMRSCISHDKVISVGEDSAICFWNSNGSLAKKILTHQNGGIWSVDAQDVLVTGGGDCSVISHPLTLATEYGDNETLNLNIDSPKKVVLTARRNLVVLNESNELIYYNVDEKSKCAYRLYHESTFKLLSVSSCKQMIAVADMNGKLDVFVENCKDFACLVNIIDTKLNNGKILSMHFAGNRHLVFCLENGEITVLASDTENYADFTLPNCKERWLTATAIDLAKNILIVGDRCGNIHVYVKGQKNPVKTFNKVHGRYGPTSITIKNNEFVTTGRDGTIKYFTISKNKIRLMSAKDLEFKWVEKFLDRDENVVCGFQERIFVVGDVKNNSKLLEVPCGGGHRSWDAVRYMEKVDGNFEEFIKLVYLKNSDINIAKFQVSKIVSKNIINGSHSKEINCLKSIHFHEQPVTFYISGGEDTTLRISSIKSDVFEERVIFKQLSSIRAIKICRLYDNTYLWISAGGRAQICIKVISFDVTNDVIKVQSREILDYMIKGTDKARKVNQNWRNSAIDFDPETRIMDVECTKTDETFTIFAGCSDAVLRVFTLKDIDNEPLLTLIKELKYHKTCILKTTCVEINNEIILVTCTTRGEMAFWNIQNDEPFFVTHTNQSGINSFAYKVINDRLVTVTGGDDNAMHIVYLEISNQDKETSMKVLDAKILDKAHSSEITGLVLVDNLVLSTSIDQRISLFEWCAEGDNIKCIFLSQNYSDVADIQGMDVVMKSSSSITVCVHGKGLEVIVIPINK